MLQMCVRQYFSGSFIQTGYVVRRVKLLLRRDQDIYSVGVVSGLRAGLPENVVGFPAGVEIATFVSVRNPQSLLTGACRSSLARGKATGA
jgi:hypothetical protein